jgi:hypothetical protein
VVPVGLDQACNDPLKDPSHIVVFPNSVIMGITLAN